MSKPLIFWIFSFSWALCGLEKVYAQMEILPSKSMIYRTFGVKKIEKIILGDSTLGQADFVTSVEELNTFGYPAKQTNYDENGVSSIQVFSYLYDSIMVRSQWTQVKDSNFTVRSTEHSRNKNNKLKSLSFYEEDRLLTTIKYKYSKQGVLLSETQKLFGNKKKGSISSKIETYYTYDDNGIVTEKYTVTKKNKKTTQKQFYIVFSEDRRIKEEYLVNDVDDKNIIRHRNIYDDKGRLKVSEHFSSSGSTYHFNNRQIKVEKGKSLRNEYSYDDRGIVVFEKISTDDGQEIKIKYKYSN
jgi:hypothetical protein